MRSTVVAEFPMPVKKRLFDLVSCALTAAVWIPVLIVTAFLLTVCQGLPTFYVSVRRVYGGRSIRLYKFRTMVRNAEAIANRNTIPCAKSRFLNITADSPLYTEVGRIIERFQLTELPQLLHVLSGQMSLVGNRPLPENVIAGLEEHYPFAQNRFAMPCGLTGPVQLIGREAIDDEHRLRLEIAYCRACAEGYSMKLDLTILAQTVLLVLGLRRPFTLQGVLSLLERFRTDDFRGFDGAIEEKSVVREV